MFTPVHWVHTGIHSHLITCCHIHCCCLWTGTWRLGVAGERCSSLFSRWHGLHGRRQAVVRAEQTLSSLFPVVPCWEEQAGWETGALPTGKTGLHHSLRAESWFQSWMSLCGELFTWCGRLHAVQRWTLFLPLSSGISAVPSSARGGRSWHAGKNALQSFIVSSFTLATLHSATGQHFQVRDNEAILWLPHSHCWLFTVCFCGKPGYPQRQHSPPSWQLK